MAKLIDLPAHFSNYDTGVPPVPPEAHPRANFQQRKFLVAKELRETLATGDDSSEQAAMQIFLETFVAHELEGSGFWTWGKAVDLAKCEVCHLERACIEAIWNFVENDDE